jgi:hypothetical protein
MLDMVASMFGRAARIITMMSFIAMSSLAGQPLLSKNQICL